jgi:hypothetical protein
MTAFVKVLDRGLRVIAGAALLLGVAFWFGYARELTVVHMGLGSLMVVCLWVLAVVVWLRTRRTGLTALALAWGAGTWAFGVFQAAILPGPAHGVIAVAHLAAGVAAVVIGGRLASAYGPEGRAR